MPKEETRTVMRVPLYEEKTRYASIGRIDDDSPSERKKRYSKTWPSMNAQELNRELARLQHQLWEQNGGVTRILDEELVLHGETLIDAAKRIWQKEKPANFNCDDRSSMLKTLQDAITGRHGQYLTSNIRFDAKASVPNWPMINSQTMKSNEYGTVIIWNQPKQATTTQENPPMSKTMLSKTMYDSHLDSTGNATPIFMLEDDHLERIIAGKAKQFANLRAKMSESPASSDPMIAAMGKSQKWSAEQLQANTRLALGDIHPYIAEALVRGSNSLVQASIDSMRILAKREAKIDPPQELLLIAMDEEESF